MARVGTKNLNLGKWLDGENPGSGPQDGTKSDGLNGDKDKIDEAIGEQHNPDGSHKASVIDGANLKPTVVDGITLEQDVSTKKLRIKDAAITASKLASDVAALFTAISDGLTAHKSSGDHDVRYVLKEDSLTTLGIETLIDDKIAASLRKITIPVSFATSTNHNSVVGDRETSGTVGVPLPAGKIGRIYITTETGYVTSYETLTGISVADGSTIRLQSTTQGLVQVYINNSATSMTISTGGSNGWPAFGLITMTI